MPTKATSDMHNLLLQAQTAGIIKFDANDAAPDYIGLADSSASDDDTDWILIKFTYSGDNVTTIEKARGSWTNRTTYF